MLFAATCAAEPLFVADFESAGGNQRLAAENWPESGLPDFAWFQGFEDDRVVVDDTEAASGGCSMRVAYPAGGVGPSETGAQAAFMLPPQREYFASYHLRFGEGFSWGSEHEGGKLPGLAADELCSGGQACDGSNGFNARLMWRRGGRAVLYLYHMDKPGKYGEDFELVYPSGAPVGFTRGEWFHVVERVRINTKDKQDGLAQVWVNGEEVLLKEGLRFVSNGDLIDTFFFSTFHEGADAAWAPQRDSFIWFDRFAIGDSYSSVAGEDRW